MLIVTGASGQLGRKVIHELLRLVPAERIAASVRNPQKLADFAAKGVRVRRGDYEDPASLLQAWEGARRVLLVSSNAGATGGDTLKQHAAAIDVARQLRVERVFYTSQISSSEKSQFSPGRNHAATEKLLEESGLAWTALRHGFYADSAVAMNVRGFEAGSLATPLDGKVSWVTHDDLAAADAGLLASETVIDGATPPLTGNEALDLAQLASLAGEIMGKQISRTVISDADMAKNVRTAGVPEERISLMMGYFLAARAGEFAAVDSTIATILGREPETMRSFLSARLAELNR
jgi:uncharacterized protein YbjT (DUF2867 family)